MFIQLIYINWLGQKIGLIFVNANVVKCHCFGIWEFSNFVGNFFIKNNIQ